MRKLIRVAECNVIVRVPSADIKTIQAAADAGADGLIVPVRSMAAAEAVVAAVRGDVSLSPLSNFILCC